MKVDFERRFYHKGCVECHTPFRCTPESISNSEVSHPVGTNYPQHSRTGMDTGTSMEVTASPHHSGPIEPAARIPPVPAAAARGAGTTSISSVSNLLVLPLLPWDKPRRRGPVPAKRRKRWQQRQTRQPQGLYHCRRSAESAGINAKHSSHRA